MDPDAPWQGSQNAAARKAVETTDAAWPTMVRRSLMAEEAKSFRSYCLARKRSEKAKEISEDEHRRAAEQLQKLTDQTVANLDRIGQQKETELLEV